MVKSELKSIKPLNYTIDNQKISFEFLKSHLWSAADILRGSLDPSEYRQPVMTLLFLKRLNDTFEENAEKLIEQNQDHKPLPSPLLLPIDLAALGDAEDSVKKIHPHPELEFQDCIADANKGLEEQPSSLSLNSENAVIEME